MKCEFNLMANLGKLSDGIDRIQTAINDVLSTHGGAKIQIRAAVMVATVSAEHALSESEVETVRIAVESAARERLPELDIRAELVPCNSGKSGSQSAEHN